MARPVISSIRINAATTMQVASAATALTTKGSAEGLMSSSALPMAASHALPNSGPYHRPPSANATAVATMMAHQLRPTKSSMLIPCLRLRELWCTVSHLVDSRRRPRAGQENVVHPFTKKRLRERFNWV